ncbi:phosphatase PAP2 family protein [Pseudovibrio flavus]|uniref:phosphatase PAP2 family protein n=1 Tax=Pseudovibrio flavus TaxID=2529854 RepID=UPI00211B9592|nr:phosphatase PAP2 family protein [Pseudovibrio flavus]
MLLAGIAFVFFDVHVHQWVAGVDEKLKGFARSITDIGKSHWMLIGSGVICLGLLCVDVRQLAFRSRVGFAALYTYAAYIFFTVAASGITVVLFKWGLGRARPVLMEQVGPIFFSPLELHSRYTSFPSGHSTSIAAMSVALALIFPSYRWLILVVGFWIAFSRILVGAHYPSDVVTGIALGAAFSLYCARWMAKRRIGFRFTGKGHITPIASWASLRSLRASKSRAY